MQVGEILLGSRWPIERLHVGRELDQVTGHEPRREPPVPEQLHEQPRGVTAGARTLRERELRRLYARLHADEVLDVFREFRVELDEEVDGALAVTRNGAEIGLEPRFA